MTRIKDAESDTHELFVLTKIMTRIEAFLKYFIKKKHLIR